jgi:hypothetical protein
MITFSFTPTKDDYIKSFRTFYRANWQTWIRIPLILTLIALLSFVATMFGKGSLDDKLTNPGGLLAFGLLIGIGIFLYTIFMGNPLKVWKQVEANERLHCHVEYEVNDEQILIRTKFAETKMDWGTFTAFIETPDVFLLIYSTNKNMFQIIPQRAFVSVNDIEAFKQLLFQKNMKKLRVLGMPNQ